MASDPTPAGRSSLPGDRAAPAVSVVIPTYDAAPLVASAVASALGDPGDVLEVIVVDDGSSDDTAAVVAALGPPVRYVRRPNGGPAAARNTGVELAHAPLVAFLDVDDRWEPGSLPARVAALAAEPAVDVVVGAVRYEGLAEAERRTYRFPGGGDTVFVPHLGAGLFRREVFDRFGPFDPELRQYEDYEWFIRARDLGARIRYLDRVCYRYRRRPGSSSQLAGPSASDLLRILGRSARRRRELGAPPTAATSFGSAPAGRQDGSGGAGP